MKVLHISTSDHSGAANAAIKIHNSLLSNGVDSYILFLSKTKSDVKNSCYFEKKHIDDSHTTPVLLLKNYLKERFFRYHLKQKIAHIT